MQLIKYENEIAVLSPGVAEQIKVLENIARKTKERLDGFKKDIIEEMEANGIIKLENDKIVITYIQPTDRETLDGKALKAELPEIYDSYVKMSPVKASVRIKVK